MLICAPPAAKHSGNTIYPTGFERGQFCGRLIGGGSRRLRRGAEATETVMSRQIAQQTSTTTRSEATLSPIPPLHMGRGWSGELGHHRYYGSSACNGGEQIV